MPHDSKKDDDGIIDLRGNSKDRGEPEFKIGRVEEEKSFQKEERNDEADDIDTDYDGHSIGGITSVPLDELESASLKPGDKVKVKFDKFVALVETHDCEEVFENHMDEDIIISTDLLADLANAHEEKPDRKIPFLLVVAFLLGIGVTWLILRS